MVTIVLARAAEALRDTLFRLVWSGRLGPRVFGLALGTRRRRISAEELREFEARPGVETHVFEERSDEPFEGP
jgi:hypothetical protein